MSPLFYLFTKYLLAASFVAPPIAPIIPLPEPDEYHMFRSIDGLLIRRIQHPMSKRKLRNVIFSLIKILRAITNKKIFASMVTIWLSNSRHHTPKYSLSSAITDTQANGLNKYRNMTSAWN